MGIGEGVAMPAMNNLLSRCGFEQYGLSQAPADISGLKLTACCLSSCSPSSCVAWNGCRTLLHSPRRWVPKQERSRSLALVYSGMYTGSILGLALSPHMVTALLLCPRPLTGDRSSACCEQWLAANHYL